MPAKKGQAFNQYSEETKKEAVRLRLEEGWTWTYSRIMEKFGIKSESQIITWVRAQVEYLKKLNPNLHGEGSWISKPGASPFEK